MPLIHLQVRQDQSEGFYVEGLTQMECPSQASAVAAMAHAQAWRHTRAHQLNSCSSRSHCLMSFVFRSQGGEQEDGQAGPRRNGAYTFSSFLSLAATPPSLLSRCA